MDERCVDANDQAAQVYIVILAHNNSADTLAAVRSLQEMTFPSFCIIVVDNASTDGTPQLLRRDHPDVRVLVRDENSGFAAGMNAGIRLALDEGTEYVLVANNDIVVDPAMLTNLVAAMSPGVGAVAPMIYYYQEPDRIWSSGFSMNRWFLDMCGGARGERDTGQQRDPFDVDCLLGCAVLLRSTLLDDVGLFDERFFFYYEDLDLSWRARKKGYRLLTVPTARVWHKVAGSAGLDLAFRRYHLARGSVLFFCAHAQRFQWLVGTLYRIAGTLKKTVEFSAHGRFDLIRSHWRGMRDGLRACRCLRT